MSAFSKEMLEASLFAAASERVPTEPAPASRDMPMKPPSTVPKARPSAAYRRGTKQTASPLVSASIDLPITAIGLMLT
jgi:hypothetical protein